MKGPSNCRTGPHNPATQEAPGNPPPGAVVRRSLEQLGALGLRRGVAWGGRPRIPLALGPQDAAPLLVLGYWHPALDADAHPLPRFGIA